jgi:gluconokinase
MVALPNAGGLEQHPAEACKLLVMGVSGCGKSTLAARLARGLGGPLIEGDDDHPASNVEKMQRGIALDDADRLPWLDILGKRLADVSGPAVLTCSALKKSYRERLRARVPGLRIAFMDIDLPEATQRLSARKNHFFNPKLVTSQFQTLESPLGESGVFRVSSLLALPQQTAAVAHWLQSTTPAGTAFFFSPSDLAIS